MEILFKPETQRSKMDAPGQEKGPIQPLMLRFWLARRLLWAPTATEFGLWLKMPRKEAAGQECVEVAFLKESKWELDTTHAFLSLCTSPYSVNQSNLAFLNKLHTSIWHLRNEGRRFLGLRIKSSQNVLVKKGLEFCQGNFSKLGTC